MGTINEDCALLLKLTKRSHKLMIATNLLASYGCGRITSSTEGCDADHTPPSSAKVKKELSYTSIHPMGPSGPVTGFPLPLYLTEGCTIGSATYYVVYA
jgi:hypothetical protein